MLKSVPELVQQIRPQLRCVSAHTARHELKENKGVIIDVREPLEVVKKPSPSAINIPRGVLEMKISELHLQSEAPIYIHCATGARAALSAEQLERIGYKRVSVITCDIETICRT